MANLDLSDFLILKEIHRTRSITGAVDNIGLSQPSISIRLSHLRQHFGDPLFVRTSAGMMPTPRMENLLPRINQALELLGPKGGGSMAFDPVTSNRAFRIGFTHVGQMILLPQLLALLEKQAPHLKIEAVDLDEQTGKMLESGEVDLALGYTMALQAGFYQQTFFTEEYVCIARSDHPRAKDKLSVAQFKKEAYVSLVAPGTGHSQLDKALQEQGIQRTIKVRVPSYLGLVQIITSTDLLAIVSARLASSLAASGQIKVLKIPVPTPSYEVRQYWHERYHREPENCWLRQFIFDTFADMPPAPEIEPG